jgi:hypothetical protein
MPPNPFYEIDPNAYIYKSTTDLENPDQKPKPEEKIRQWALYELIVQ